MDTNKDSTLPNCSQCGAKVQLGDRFCGTCGVALRLSPKAQPQKASLENDLPSPTRKSPAEEYGFEKKGSWIFGTVYVPKTLPRKEHESGAEAKKGRPKSSGLSPEIIKEEKGAFLVCQACGQKLRTGDRVCVNCGTEVGNATLLNSEKTKSTQTAEHPEEVYGQFPDDQVVEKGFSKIAAANTETMRLLQISIETLNEYLSGLLTTIDTAKTTLFWYTVAILVFTVVLVALAGYDILFRHTP